jgi:hypothetical protein
MDTVTSSAVVVSTATAMGIPSPDNTIDSSEIVFLTGPTGLVTSRTGTATLTPVATPGQTYVVVATTVGATYAAIDTAFKGGGTPVDIAAIPAASFLAVGAATPAVRYLIIANTDPDSGVASYQMFTITFNAAM